MELGFSGKGNEWPISKCRILLLNKNKLDPDQRIDRNHAWTYDP